MKNQLCGGKVVSDERHPLGKGLWRKMSLARLEKNERWLDNTVWH